MVREVYWHDLLLSLYITYDIYNQGDFWVVEQPMVHSSRCGKIGSMATANGIIVGRKWMKFWRR